LPAEVAAAIARAVSSALSQLEAAERERLIYDDALERLAQANPGLRAPQRWFVIDEPVLNAAVYANTLMLTRGLIESGLVEPVLGVCPMKCVWLG
jgi:hypothetical protein